MKVVEFSIILYKKGEHPKNGKIIWADVFSYDIAIKKEKAIDRLFRIIKNKDKNTFILKRSNVAVLEMLPKNTSFNKKPKLVFRRQVKDIKKGEIAIKRLAKLLTHRDKDNLYFGKLEFVEQGENIYVLHKRNTEVLTYEEKKRQVELNIRGKKSAISRAKNKAKHIIKEYSKTLFPCGYKEDEKYNYLCEYIKEQEEKLKEYKKVGIDTIETVVGRVIQGVDYLKVLKG